MSNKRFPAVTTAISLFIVLSCVLLSEPAMAADYHLLRRIQLGGEGGWDYLTMDSAAHRLYISRGTHVMVLDTESGKLAGDIPDTNGVHGIALVPELGHGFTSNGRDSTVTVFDMKSLKPITTVKVGDGPDAIMYDPASKRVFTFNGRGHDTTAIDVSNNTVAGSIPLGGKPEFAVSDGKGKVYVNIEDKSELVAFDSKNLKEVARWPLAPGEEPSGLSMDIKHRRLFPTCHNKMIAVVDAETGKVVATPPIGAGVDAGWFDPETQMVLASNGEGTVTVIHEDSPDKYTVVQTLQTEPRARTMTLDEKTHNIYVVTAQLGTAPAPTAENPRPRPPMVPDSFVVLEYGTK